MAFVRKVRTGSGATAVQVVQKRHGKLEIIKHVGSGHSPVEVALLVQRGREILQGEQEALDLDIGPEADTALARPTQRQPALVPDAPPPADTSAGGTSGVRVVGTTSDVLWSTLRVAYSRLGFGIVDDEVFEQVVLARLVEPTSKLDTIRVLEGLGVDPPHHTTIYRHLRQAQDRHYRDQIATKCFEHAATSGDVSLVLYDVTTLYFEAEYEDRLRKVGYSKERRVDPQIVVGLLVDRNGFPLEIGCFEGNHAETRTIVPIIKQFQARHNLADMVVVADAGMLSTANLTALDDANLKFIVGSRQVKAPGDLANHFHWNGAAFEDGQLIDTITPRHGNTKTERKRQRREPVWDPEEHPGHWRAVWAFSKKRATRDGHTLTAQENRARAVIDGDAAVKSTRFVKTTAAGRALDEASLERARGLVGLKGYVTNISATIMPPAEVLSSYHDLWQVEQSFRMSKSDLQARPMFHRQRDSIEAHLTIVFTALAIARFMQNTTGLSLKRIITTLRPIQSALLQAGDHTQLIPPQIPENAATIIEQITGQPGH
ncbi:IS1634 family transposase [Kocuria sp. ZOR0020]|uniref:IS1634 family transposase n=1 Tax=Kocuria sp. ZOR0020 TaxID=1339234 RepID=UPI0006491F5C|nr:IS1634 family transposase [Kocuria sp. ZOR0020]